MLGEQSRRYSQYAEFSPRCHPSPLREKQNAETIRWYAIDDKIEKAVHNGTFAVARAAERLECRKVREI